MFVKSGDKVRVISGKDKGKEGTIKTTFAKENRVIVEGVNMIKKHQKPSNAYPQGGVIDTEAPIQASNVMLIDSSTNEQPALDLRLLMAKRFALPRNLAKRLTNL